MNYVKPLTVALCILQTGCSAINGAGGWITSATQALTSLNFKPTSVWLQKIHFKIDPDANQNSAILVHSLIVYDKSTLEQLSKLSADQYFKGLDQLKRDKPEQISPVSFEVVPGQMLQPKDIDLPRTDGIGVIIFARYTTPGEHRQLIGEDREVIVHLRKLDFTVDKYDPSSLGDVTTNTNTANTNTTTNGQTNPIPPN